MNRDRSGSIAVILQQVVYINLQQTFLLWFMFMLPNTILLPYLTMCPLWMLEALHIFFKGHLFLHGPNGHTAVKERKQ